MINAEAGGAPVEQPDQPRMLSAEEIEGVLLLTFDRAARLRDVISHYQGSPELGSPLRRDDELAHPYGLSHAVMRQLQAAVDHLDAVRVLIVEAQKIHNAAPFTLTRGALETAAAAVWMLSPSNRNERVLRCLRHMVRDAIDADHAATAMGLTTHKPLAQRRTEINERAREITGLPNFKVGPETSTNIVRAADAAAGLTLDALSAWQACSGFAHGRLWATLSVLEKEELPGAEDGMHRLRVTTPLDRVFWVMFAATDLTDYGFNLLQERSAALYR